MTCPCLQLWRDRASRGRLMTLWPGSRTVDSHGDLRDLRQIVNCKHR